MEVVEIIIPYMIDVEINKYMLNYELLENHINDILTFLEKCNYIVSLIPDDNKEFQIISNKDYCATFSCFQSIYQYIHNDNENLIALSDEENELNAVKKEILPFLQECDEKYKKKNALRRTFFKRFINIISTANLKLEKCICNEFYNNSYILENIYYERRNKIKEMGINKAIIKAVEDRDNITHNKTINLDDISIGIYEIIAKLNYTMILNKAEIPTEKIKKSIINLTLRHVI